MPAEIVIYALIAAGLVFWLRSILGTRHGDERQRPNPFSAPPEKTTQNPALSMADQNGNTDAAVNPVDAALELPKNGVGLIANPATENALREIARLDRNFTLAHFITGAQDAFVMIIEAFANGDRALLKSLLAPDLYKAFDQALNDRAEQNHTMSAEIHAIRKVEIQDAQIKDKTAYLTIRFVADETVVTRGADGTIVSGNPDRVSETIDIWTLGKILGSKDPTWYLFATREEDTSSETLS